MVRRYEVPADWYKRKEPTQSIQYNNTGDPRKDDDRRNEKNFQTDSTPELCETAGIAGIAGISRNSRISRVSFKLGGKVYSEEIEKSSGRKRYKATVFLETLDRGEIKIVDDYVVFTPEVRIWAEYAGKTYDNPFDIVTASSRHITVNDITNAIDKLKTNVPVETVPIVEYVEKHYPDDAKKVKENPLGYFLPITDEYFYGEHTLKTLLIYLVIDSRRKDVTLHPNIIVLGQSNEGKTRLVESIFNMIPSGQKWYQPRIKLTKEVLTYRSGDVSGLLFIDNVNDFETLERLDVFATSKHHVTEYTTKDELGNMTASIVESYGTLAYCVTSTTIFFGENAYLVYQKLTRTIVVYVNQNPYESLKSTLLRKKIDEYDIKTQLMFMYFLLTRPPKVSVPEEIRRKIYDDMAKVIEASGGKKVNRFAEMFLRLIEDNALLNGRDTATIDDYQYVKDNFSSIIFINAFGITPQELDVLKAIKDGDTMPSDIARRTGIPTPDIRKILKTLMMKGAIYVEYDDANRVEKIELLQIGENALGFFESMKNVPSDVLRKVYDKLNEDERCDAEKVRQKFSEYDYNVDDERLRKILISWGCHKPRENASATTKSTSETTSRQTTASAMAQTLPREDVIIDDVGFWKQHVKNNFGYNPFSAKEFAKTIEGFTEEDATKILDALVEKGVLMVVYVSKDGKKLYAVSDRE